MEGEVIATKDFLEELKAMVNVCFECEVKLSENLLRLEFPNGQIFSIQCSEA